jgi:hypothetical protein
MKLLNDVTEEESKLSITVTKGQENIPKESATILIYGDPGSAKTPFAGSFGDRTLYINIGAGISTLYSPKFESIYGKWNGIRVDITEPDQFKPSAFNDVCDTIDKFNSEHDSDFDTIVIDDASALQYFAQNQALSINSDLQKSPGAAQSKKYGVNMMGLADYGAEKSLVDQFMRTYADDCKARGKNFIVIAHAKRDYGKPPAMGQPGPLESIYPAFTGQNRIASYFDYVWYATVEQGKAIVVTEGDNIIEARSRFAGIFPTRYFNPNAKDMTDALESYYKTGKVPDAKYWESKRSPIVTHPIK